MCEAFAQRMASAINDGEVPGLRPFIVAFSGTDCTGNTTPDLTKGFSTPATDSVSAPWTVRSVYVPFFMPAVTAHLSSSSAAIVTLPPGFISDMRGFGAVGNSDVRFLRPASGALAPPAWDVVSRGMCMGDVRTIGRNAISRWSPESDACDREMREWCKRTDTGSSTSNMSNPACACFSDEPVVRAIGGGSLTLPVRCFGRRCATERSYKTRDMMAAPCNATVCQQQIRDNVKTGLNAEKAVFEVFCDGVFYTGSSKLDGSGKDTSSSLRGEGGSPPASGGDAAPGVLIVTETFWDTFDWPIWVALGVATVVVVIMAAVIFSTGPRPISDVPPSNDE